MRYRIKEGRAVTLKMGTAKPGYEFGVEEVNGDDPKGTLEQLYATGYIEIVEVEEKVIPEAVVEAKEPEPKKKTRSRRNK